MIVSFALWPSFLITDSGKVEDKPVVVLYCKLDDVHKEIRSCARYLSVVTPNTDGLVNCLREALKLISWKDMLCFLLSPY